LGALREEFLERSVPLAREELSRRLRSKHGLRSAALRRHATLEAQELARALADRLRVEVTDKGEVAYRAATARFADLADQFLRRLGAAGELNSVEVPDAGEFDLTVRVPPRIPYTDMLWRASVSPHGWLLDAVTPAVLLRSSIRRFANGYLATLLETNAARVVNDFDDRARESEVRLQAEIRQRLGALTASADHALALARDRIARGQPAVAAELARLGELSLELEAIVVGVSTGPASSDPRRA
jgi:hypothetical protein